MSNSFSNALSIVIGESSGMGLATGYMTDCQPCNVPARQAGRIYTHGYPAPWAPGIRCRTGFPSHQLFQQTDK
jgi:hypothetical protein